jgi:hypothetical protein
MDLSTFRGSDTYLWQSTLDSGTCNKAWLQAVGLLCRLLLPSLPWIACQCMHGPVAQSNPHAVDSQYACGPARQSRADPCAWQRAGKYIAPRTTGLWDASGGFLHGLLLACGLWISVASIHRALCQGGTLGESHSLLDSRRTALATSEHSSQAAQMVHTSSHRAGMGSHYLCLGCPFTARGHTENQAFPAS